MKNKFRTQTKEHHEKLLKIEDDNLRKLHKIVLNSMAEEEELVNKLYQEYHNTTLTFAERWADKLAAVAGSWNFIISFTVFLIAWMVLNNVLGIRAFDASPYILLNLILSCLAAIQAPVILMSQNRKDNKDHKVQEHEYLINLKSELEVRALNRKLDLLIIDQMHIMSHMQKEQLRHITKLERKLDNLQRR